MCLARSDSFPSTKSTCASIFVQFLTKMLGHEPVQLVSSRSHRRAQGGVALDLIPLTGGPKGGKFFRKSLRGAYVRPLENLAESRRDQARRHVEDRVGIRDRLEHLGLLLLWDTSQTMNVGRHEADGFV
jgi:hypothetical protein